MGCGVSELNIANNHCAFILFGLQSGWQHRLSDHEYVHVKALSSSEGYYYLNRTNYRKHFCRHPWLRYRTTTITASRKPAQGTKISTFSILHSTSWEA